MYYVCVLHTVITFGQAPGWNQHSWLFENSPTHLIPQLSTVRAGMHSLKPFIFVSGQDTQETLSLDVQSSASPLGQFRSFCLFFFFLFERIKSF